MSITLLLSTNLSRIAKRTEGFEVNGGAVSERVNELIRLIPAMKNALFYESRLNATTNRWFESLDLVLDTVQRTTRCWLPHKIRRLCKIT